MSHGLEDNSYPNQWTPIGTNEEQSPDTKGTHKESINWKIGKLITIWECNIQLIFLPPCI